MTDDPTTSAGSADDVLLIACPAVLGELADGATDGVRTATLEAQLHISPERLKVAMRAAVAAADKPGATIVLGLWPVLERRARASRPSTPLSWCPRVDDCIAMMLGSNEAFAAESAKARGSYYVAKAYLDECDTIMSEHEKLVEKRGVERAERMMRLLLEHYTRIVLINTGRYDVEPSRARITPFAETFDLDDRRGDRDHAHPGRARGGRLGRRFRCRPSGS